MRASTNNNAPKVKKPEQAVGQKKPYLNGFLKDKTQPKK